MFDNIDERGFRPNVGIILINDKNQVFWAKRLAQNGWQFPQGGIDATESIEAAMYRELQEEIGLTTKDVAVIAVTDGWIYYRLPKQFIRWRQKPVCYGQKQKWYLLRLVGSEENIQLDQDSTPEFSEWQWVDYWHPLEHIIEFKKDVYREALKELYVKLPRN